MDIDKVAYARRLCGEVEVLCGELVRHAAEVQKSEQEANRQRQREGLSATSYVRGEISFDTRKSAALRRRSLDLSRALADMRQR